MKVTIGVAQHDEMLRQAAKPLQADKVALQHFDHGRPRQARDRGGGEPAQRDRGQDEVGPRTIARCWRPAQGDGEEQHQHQGEPEKRGGLTDGSGGADDRVEPAVATDGRHYAHGQADQRREDHRRDGKIDGGRKTIEDQRERRLIIAERIAEIATQHVAHEADELFVDRPVEAQLIAEEVQVGLRRLSRHEQRHRIAGQTGQSESDDGNDDQGSQHLGETPDYKFRHMAFSQQRGWPRIFVNMFTMCRYGSQPTLEKLYVRRSATAANHQGNETIACGVKRCDNSGIKAPSSRRFARHRK